MSFPCTKDISKGIEKQPVIVDCRDQVFEALNKSLKYVKTSVAGPGFDEELFSERYVGCSCLQKCSEQTCACLEYFGSAYDLSGHLKPSFVDQMAPARPILECGDECSCCEDRCFNRVVQKGPMARFSVFHSDRKGFGLKVLGDLQKLSFVCEYAGEVVGLEEAKRRLQCTDGSGESNYLIVLRELSSVGEACLYVDPRHIGNLGRFINHSCDPNLIMLPVRINHSVPRLALFARRDLKAGEELTFDYSGKSFFNSNQNQLADLSFDIETKGCGQNGLTGRKMIGENLLGINASVGEVSEIDDGIPRKKRKLDSLHPCVFSRPLSNDVDDMKDNVNEGDTNISPSGVSTGQTRRSCFCGSDNCRKFLPFDTSLLC